MRRKMDMQDVVSWLKNCVFESTEDYETSYDVIDAINEYVKCNPPTGLYLARQEQIVKVKYMDGAGQFVKGESLILPRNIGPENVAEYARLAEKKFDKKYRYAIVEFLEQQELACNTALVQFWRGERNEQ